MIWRHLLRIVLLAVGHNVGSFFAAVVAYAAAMSPGSWDIMMLPYFVFFFPILTLDWAGIAFDPDGVEWIVINNLFWVVMVYAGWLLYVRLCWGAPAPSLDEGAG